MTLQGKCRLGGRAARYARGQLLRVTFLDPWRRRHLQFRSKPIQELWMLRQADEGIRSIEVADLRSPDSRSTQVLELTTDCGRTRRESVATRRGEQRNHRVASDVYCVSRSELLTKQCEIRNIDLLRRAAVQWLDVSPEDLIARVLDRLATDGPLPMAALYASANRPTEVDAALSHAWRRRLVAVDLTVPFGSKSMVASKRSQEAAS